MPFLLDLLLKLFVFHCAFYLERLHLLGFFYSFFLHLELLLSDPFDKLLGFFGAFAKQMKLVPPDLSLTSRSSASVDRSRDQTFVARKLAFVDLLSKIN